MTAPWVVTGAAGFIGYHACARILGDGHGVVGVDNCNAYYDPRLKHARIDRLRGHERYHASDVDLRRVGAFDAVLAEHSPEVVIHLAAQAGVRHSLDHPEEYLDNNLVAFGNVLEACRRRGVRHLVYASSSSVYGETSRVPFSTRNPAEHPVSLYAATKRANELMAHSYSHLFGLPCTGLRFFTVYGPWGRPDMAYYRFAEAILDGRPITVYGDGTAQRDFTYVDDIVEGVVRIAGMPAQPDPAWSAGAGPPDSSASPWRVYNIGHGGRATVNDLISVLERLLGRTAARVHEPAQPGDVATTQADVGDLPLAIRHAFATPLDVGLRRFTEWLITYRAG